MERVEVTSGHAKNTPLPTTWWSLSNIDPLERGRARMDSLLQRYATGGASYPIAARLNMKRLEQSFVLLRKY